MFKIVNKNVKKPHLLSSFSFFSFCFLKKLRGPEQFQTPVYLQYNLT